MGLKGYVVVVVGLKCTQQPRQTHRTKDKNTTETDAIIKGRTKLVDASKWLLLFSGATLFGLPEMNMYIFCKKNIRRNYVFLKKKNYLRVVPNAISRKC